jgi:chromosome segregation ATPase
MATEAQTQPDFWSRLGRGAGRFFGLLLRLLFVVLLAVAIGAGVYFGLPALYRSLVQPVQNHTTQIQLLNNRMDNLATSFDGAQSVQDQRLTTLETSGDDQRQRLGAAETGLGDVKTALADETASRAELVKQVAELQAQLEAQAETAKALRSDLDELKPQVSASTASLAALQQQMGLLHLQNGLLQARLQVVYENLGDARQLLATSASELKAFIQEPKLLPADAQAALVLRVTTAEALIQQQPASALTELESVWAELDRRLNEKAGSQ